MEGDRAQRHRCKVCRKNFPSGRSLGGHMRSHVHAAAGGSSETDAEERPTPGIRGAGYGLRENPKKTWRLSDYTGYGDEKQCRECGKEFSSWRALFGHMKCHSERICQASEAQEEQEGSWSNGGQSESEAAAVAVPRRRRGSRRTAAAIDSSPSSVSEYEREEEEGAISLMMLSRDVWHSGGGGGGGGGIQSVAESSDKNSVGFEAKGIGEGDGDFVSRNGYWRNGLKRVESNASDDCFARESEFKKPKVCNSDADEFENSDEKSRKDSSKKKDPNSAVVTESGLKRRLDGSEFEVEKQRFEVSDAKFGRDYVERFRFDASDGGFDKAPERRSRFECATCNKTFHSYQALGGHRASHKRMKGCSGSENSLEADASIDRAAVEEMVDRGASTEAANGLPKKAKGHECLLCGKVFASGQALGGHKRSHLVVNSEDRGVAASRQPIVIQQQPLEVPDLLDLNLPAPMDGDSNSTTGDAELKSWWAGSNLVGVISN